MKHDSLDQQIDQLLDSIKRVAAPDKALFRRVILESGLPDSTQHLKYLKYNQQVIPEQNRTQCLSLVALLNNRFAQSYQLTGFRKKLSLRIFAYSRNHMDVFLNNLRCDERIIELMSTSQENYSLLGILQSDEIVGSGMFKKRYRNIAPVVAIPRIEDKALETVIEFENANVVRKVKRRILPFYKRIRPAGQGLAI